MNSQLPGPGPESSPRRDPLPPFDLRAYLLGAWTADRTMVDRATDSHGTFTGVVRFTETDDGGLRFREEGTVQWNSVQWNTVQWNPAGAKPFTGPASREYLLRPSATPETMEMFFPDGRPFHRMGFGGEDSQDRHWCDPDTYRVRYTLAGADGFSYRWEVTGPAKDLLLETVLRRVPHADGPAAGAPAAITRPGGQQ